MGEEKCLFEQLTALMPEGWEAQAKALGALQRAREIKTPEDLLCLILLCLTEGKSFGGTSAILCMEGEWQLSKKAIWSRIGNSAEWLRWLCERLCRRQGILAEKPAWLLGKHACLVDGTEEVLRGSKKACYMPRYGVDLFSLAMREMRLTDMKAGEKLANFTVFGRGISWQGTGRMGRYRGWNICGSGGVIMCCGCERGRSGCMTGKEKKSARQGVLGTWRWEQVRAWP
ncbi:MAG: hypothetical protein LBG27_03680 [Spirochaetaceae bacterium]|jgi:hypothetical protein|nr:hypothetical protein [Spirochaetaceae bacterium]